MTQKRWGNLRLTWDDGTTVCVFQRKGAGETSWLFCMCHAPWYRDIRQSMNKSRLCFNTSVEMCSGSFASFFGGASVRMHLKCL
ncbi:hypothetical protein [Desulfosporosinus sp. Sb-LF]|uniref:hypothetical protein n=1 Tax=Desulfosporosinus sp. Sb-LF TaxID=2560027 RepID=UPI00110527DB|nr:hypothetical protein [Desulfosporosinus sp. Sb-LF]TGE31932.1 hypothetical protein E4K68_14685 [Desulfosporosinus sp. Sb-LF]